MRLRAQDLRGPFALLRPGWPDEARRLIQEPVFIGFGRKHPLDGRCLNAGCGEGLYSDFIEQFAGVTEIVNLDLELPSVARHRDDSRHSDVAGSVTDLPFGSESFSSLMCSEVLEHVEDDRLAAAEIGRVLKPGGVAIVSTPTPPAPHDPAHVREGYTLPELTAVLRHGGLEVVDHSFAFHAPMRALVRAWAWQYARLGKGRRSVMPRALILGVALLDRALRPGRPWDVMVVAIKRTD